MPFTFKLDPERSAGSWWPVLKHGNKAGVIWRCPKCGTRHAFTSHTIYEDGEVQPSVVCSRPHCDFHEYVTLDEVQPECVTRDREAAQPHS